MSLMMPGESDCRGGAAHEPQWSNEEINRVPEEGRLIAFDRVSYELENPADDKEREGPAPVEEEEGQRDDDQRNTDAV